MIVPWNVKNSGYGLFFSVNKHGAWLVLRKKVPKSRSYDLLSMLWLAEYPRELVEALERALDSSSDGKSTFTLRTLQFEIVRAESPKEPHHVLKAYRQGNVVIEVGLTTHKISRLFHLLQAYWLSEY